MENRYRKARELIMITECGLCGSNNMEVRHEDQQFDRRVGESIVTLSAFVRVHVCLDCGAKFGAPDAHAKCHEAVCRYLNILTPSDIKELRRKLGLTQTEFAELTGIAIASINNWERGKRVQSKALDNFLYLLGVNNNHQELLSRRQKKSNVIQFPRKFPHLQENDPELYLQQANFYLG